MLKLLTLWITTNWKILKEMEIPTTLPASCETCTQVKKQQLEPDMEQWTGSKLGKEYIKTILSPCLFNLCAEYFTRNAGLDEVQAGIKIARRNICVCVYIYIFFHILFHYGLSQDIDYVPCAIQYSLFSYWYQPPRSSVISSLLHQPHHQTLLSSSFMLEGIN